MNVSQLNRDTAKCADAYLAAHLASEEPITEEWLREIGFAEECDSWAVWRLFIGELSIELDRWPPTGEWRVFVDRGGIAVSLFNEPPKHRPQLRHLLAALGCR